MSYILLTGAGFSRNWGGWLADEVFEFLLGSPEIDDHIKHLLWKNKISGDGFEGALAYLQEEDQRQKNPQTEKQLSALQNALGIMFDYMNKGFSERQFDDVDWSSLQRFLTKFEAIFTLNQDTLIEQRYMGDNVCLCSSGKWDGGCIPGVKLLAPLPSNMFDPAQRRAASQTPDSSNFNIPPRIQPYIKLHGSSNWYHEDGQKKLLIMGGNKGSIISQFPLLAWYHKEFEKYLAKPNARLMIIGYSFGDHHINNLIEQAVTNTGLKLFIIDPAGVDVLDKKTSKLPIPTRPQTEKLGPHIFGASRRPLSSIFGIDKVEHAKVLRFFA